MATRRRWVVVASRENATRRATRGFVMVNLGKRSLLLPALAVYDSDDSSVTPKRPWAGGIGLSPQQTLRLV